MNQKPKKSSNKRSIFSIKAKVALLCTISILIAIIVNATLITNICKTAITRNTTTSMNDLATAYNANITDAVRKASQSGNMIMGSDVITSFVASGGKEKLSEVKDLVSMYLNSNSYVEEVNITDAKGIILYSSNSASIGKDLSKEDYFSKMISTKNNTQSNIFLSDSTGDACITFATPLRNGAPQITTNSTSSTASANTTAKNTSSIADDPFNQPVNEFTGAITTVMKVSELSSAISSITVADYDSGYSFVIDADGNYVYHPDKALIGTKVVIPEIKTIISEVKAGKTPTSKTISYTYKGTKKYAGYSVNASNNWILFVSADQSEIYSQINSMMSQSIIFSVVIIVLLTLVAYLVAGSITRPIRKLTALINKTADFDFTEDTVFSDLTAKKDETGEMSRAIEKMRNIMKDMILHISEVSENISLSSNNLRNISYSVNDHASDNSATAEELSASMQETAATTQHIFYSIEQISSNSKDINEKASFGENLSTELIKRADDLKATTLRAEENTRNIYLDVKQQSSAAIEQSKAVEKISILTKTITDIASQTSLLALNASIESARAGDAGRGFSVVASEIGNLADQSARTISSINEIVTEVYEAVENMSKSLEKSLEFLEKNVLTDYKGFIENNEKYNLDAKVMNEAMRNIHEEIDTLNKNVSGISESIAEINSMVEEASKGVVDVAGKNMNIVALTTNTQNMADEHTNNAASLKGYVDKFKL